MQNCNDHRQMPRTPFLKNVSKLTYQLILSFENCVQAHHDSPVSANLSSPSPEGGLADEQEQGYELFSASLSKAMKAYVLYSDPQVPSFCSLDFVAVAISTSA